MADSTTISVELRDPTNEEEGPEEEEDDEDWGKTGNNLLVRENKFKSHSMKYI